MSHLPSDSIGWLLRYSAEQFFSPLMFALSDHSYSVGVEFEWLLSDPLDWGFVRFLGVPCFGTKFGVFVPWCLRLGLEM